MIFRLRSALLLLALATASACAPALREAPSPPSPSADSALVETDAPAASAPRRAALTIVEVYGPRRATVGEVTDYRLRLAPGFEWPIQYTWDFGEGTGSVGNNVTHVFSQPGRYTVVATARNRFGADTARVDVTVEPARREVTSAPSEPLPPLPARPPFEAGDLVWIAGAHELREAAEAEVALYTGAGFPSAVVPRSHYGGDVYYVAVGGYEDEDEAIQARPHLLRTRSTPLWLLRLGPAHDAD